MTNPDPTKCTDPDTRVNLTQLNEKIIEECDQGIAVAMRGMERFPDMAPIDVEVVRVTRARAIARNEQLLLGVPLGQIDFGG